MTSATLPGMRLLLALPLIALTACGPRPDAPAAPVSAPAPAAPPAAPPSASADPVNERYQADTGGWRVAFVLQLPALPTASAARLRRACEAWLFQGLVVPRGAFADTAAEAHRLLVTDSPPTGAGWHAERELAATRLGGGWLALVRRDTSFAGGAHPNSRVEALVVELAGVRALTLDEVVPPERQPDLRQRLAAELRRSRGLPATGPLTSLVATDAELPIPLPAIHDDGLVFVWNPYEIAPYAEGAFEVRLPVADARGFLAVDPW